MTNTLLVLISFTTGSYLALSYAPPLLTSLIMGSVPTNEETLRYEAPDEFSRQIDEHIKNCELATSLRANPEFTEARPWEKIPQEIKQHNLTAGTLSGPDMVVVPPYVFTEKGGKSMTMIMYVGTHLSGHPGIVHGGFLATMMDEGLARCAFPAMPNKVGVTANLSLDYRAPTMAGQFLVLKARTIRTEGRKAWAEGWIEALDDPYIERVDVIGSDGEPLEKTEEDKKNEKRKLVEAKALFVEPRYAHVLKSLYRSAT